MPKFKQNIPQKPGVYFFKDKKGQIIYVGKANNLHHRLRSYQKRRSQTKTKTILASAASLGYQVVNSEFEALLLEARLIKESQPRYNARLKDDKRYPSIAVSSKEKYPCVYFTRKREETKTRKDSLYFGPFPSPGKTKYLLNLLRKIIPYRSCRKLPKKPCLYYHLGLCPGVCYIENKDYQKEIKQLIRLLKGQTKEVLKFLKKEMNQAAQENYFEKALKFKKQIEALQTITSKQMPVELNYLSFYQRIEGYDISNLQGQKAAGSMVVFQNGQPLKSAYRRFKIKTIHLQNDVAMLAEVLQRRINHPQWSFPDLILVDGGKPQVNQAQKVLKKNSLKIPVFGLAKREEEIVFQNGRWQTLKLKKSSPLLKLLQRIRDEAHRFAQSYHRKLRSKEFLISFLFFLFCFFPLPAFASQDFDIQQEITYDVQETGLTNVREKISLTNKTSSAYATRYRLTINTLEVKNFRAWDRLGNLQSKISHFGETIEIELVFNEKVAGLDERLTFYFSYQTEEIATLNGQIWEINLPKIENFADLADFKATLIVPENFGKNAYFLPRPSQIIPYSKKTGYLFTKDQLNQGKINAAFGEYQIFDFRLHYHLSNPSSSPKEFKISLPPDSAYQKIFYQKIEPVPSEIQLDADGNWLAFYQLATKEKMEIEAQGSTQVFLHPQYQEILSPEQKKSLLANQAYWPVEHPQIIELAKNLSSAREVYHFVLSHLDYDYQRVKTNPERLNPLEALDKKSGLCLEFADLFVTLSRAIGIPARTINGYAYSRSKKIETLTDQADILHAWAEYYDQEKQLWIPVDPTWGETTEGIDFFNKLDLNHLVLTIHGQNSELPQSPGSYQLEGSQKNDVQVQFGTTLPEIKTTLEIKLAFPQRLLAGFLASGNIEIENKGNTALYNQQLEIKSLPLKILKDTQLLIPFLPPFSKRNFKVKIEAADFFASGKNKVFVSLNEASAEKEISIISLFSLKNGLLALSIFLPAGIIFFAKYLKGQVN